MIADNHKQPAGDDWNWDGHSTYILEPDDAPRAQALFEECLDFFQLVTGLPPAADEGSRLFYDLPPEVNLDAKTVYGLFDGEKLIGVIDSIAGYPAQGTWFIGLFMLHPDCRSAGVGSAWLEAYQVCARANGVSAVRLGVVEQNAAGRRFWENNGFTLADRRPPVRYGVKDVVVLVMQKEL